MNATSGGANLHPGANCAHEHGLSEPHYEKTGFLHMKTKTQICFAVTQISFAVIVKLISAFVFATRIVQSLFLLIPKFQVSSDLLWLHSPVLSDLVGKPEDRFSHNEAQLYLCHTQLRSVCLFVLSCIKSEKTKSDSTYLFAI